MKTSIFHDLFVLELANNHWGSLERGLKIVGDFAEVVKANNVRAAIKLQFRDVDSFVQKHHRDRQDMRYIKKLLATQMPWDQLQALHDAVPRAGMMSMVTPFDEYSVEKCVEFGVEILKIASSDIRDRGLLSAIAATGKPVIASSGGSSLRDMDELVNFFAGRAAPFALNHCVSIYPSDDGELELNQIDFLRERYPDIVIGFSTHEHTDWSSSVMMAYAKGARTFERHIDIDQDGVPVAPYCSLPAQADQWFKAFNKAKLMAGPPGIAKRAPPQKETRYLDELARGVYARRRLEAGHVLTKDDIYLAIPLQRGQLSSREFSAGEVLRRPLTADAPVHLRDVDADYSTDLVLQRMVDGRGVPSSDVEVEPELKRAAN